MPTARLDVLWCQRRPARWTWGSRALRPRSSAAQAPSSVAVMSDSDVQRFSAKRSRRCRHPLCGSLFISSSRPKTLTPESRAQVPMILSAVRKVFSRRSGCRRPHGYEGVGSSNVELGLKRANIVRELLLAAQVAASAIEVSSRGESAPALATADEVDGTSQSTRRNHGEMKSRSPAVGHLGWLCSNAGRRFAVCVSAGVSAQS